MSKDSIDNMLKNERKFLEGENAVKNEHGVYIYVSDNGDEALAMDYFLNDYKNWLIENNIVKKV